MAVDEARRGRRTLIVSTDPAPSLGDALGRPLRGSPVRVPLARGSLHAVEVDPGAALDRWLRPRRQVLETIALRGTWLDESDVRRLLGLSLPGIDEIAALLELLRFARSPAYDVIVVDTAPTGHTLRMLAMPATLGGVARVFDDMQDRHRALVEALRGRRVEDAADVLVAELRHDAEVLTGLLRDPALTELTLVTLPEAMAVEETLDAAASLAASRIPVSRVVVNRVTPPPPGRCGWCEARRRTERAAIAGLTARLAAHGRDAPAPVAMSIVAARRREPIGVRALRTIAADLRARPPIQRVVASRPVGGAPRFARVPGASRPARIPPARLLIFGGKGGVGKTTCAAAAALALAASAPERRVLLVSTDPAHSLGDVLGSPLSDVAASVPGGPPNLLCRELDASRALEPLRTQYAASIDAVFDRLVRGSAIDAAHDRRVMHDLIDLAPPGLDELAAVLDLADLPAGDGTGPAPRTIVMDTAPTGHALRLLEMPAAVQEWVRTLMGILLKYQSVTGIGQLGQALLDLSRGLGRLRVLLASADAQFVVVTRAAALPRAETARLIRSLRRLRIAVHAVIVNAAGAGACSRCRSAARAEQLEIARLGRALRSPALIRAPAAVPPPAGVHVLQAWTREWRAGA